MAKGTVKPVKTTIEMAVDGIIGKLAGAKTDAVKFDSGNKSAGTRVRGALQEVVVMCKEARGKIQEQKQGK